MQGSGPELSRGGHSPTCRAWPRRSHNAWGHQRPPDAEDCKLLGPRQVWASGLQLWPPLLPRHRLRPSGPLPALRTPCCPASMPAAPSRPSEDRELHRSAPHTLTLSLCPTHPLCVALELVQLSLLRVLSACPHPTRRPSLPPIPSTHYPLPHRAPKGRSQLLLRGSPLWPDPDTE